MFSVLAFCKLNPVLCSHLVPKSNWRAQPFHTIKENEVEHGYSFDKNPSKLIANSGSETEAIMKKYIADQQKVDEMIDRVGVIVENTIKSTAKQTIDLAEDEIKERFSGWLDKVLHIPPAPKEYDPPYFDPKFIQEQYSEPPKRLP